MVESVGEMDLPCGTPLLIEKSGPLYVMSLITTFGSSRNEESNFSKMSYIFRCSILCLRPSCLTLLTSLRTIYHCALWFRSWAMNSCIIVRVVDVHLLLLNPCFVDGMSLFIST